MKYSIQTNNFDYVSVLDTILLLRYFTLALTGMVRGMKRGRWATRCSDCFNLLKFTYHDLYFGDVKFTIGIENVTI
jgi:hypothetical protein